MHNLGTVFKFEFIRTIKKPSFWISVLAFPLLFIALIAILYFSGETADKAAEDAANERFSIGITDDSGYINQALATQFGASLVDSKTTGIERVRDGQLDAFFYYPESPAKDTVEVYGQDVGLAKNGRYEQVAILLLQEAVNAQVGSEELVALLRQTPAIDVTTYDNGAESAGLQKVLAPGLFLVLFYIVIVLLAGQMLASTTEEKENRVIEMILTTIQARTLIIGKILAIVALGMLQVAVVATPAILAYVFFRDTLNVPSLDLSTVQFELWPILIGAALFVGGFMLFTGILVAIGAAVPTAKEANNFFGVVILMMVVPFYASATIVADPSQTIVKVLSFFPVTSPITLMLRNAVGNLSTLEVVAGLVIVFVSGIIAITVAIRTFRYGTVEYSRRIGLKEMFSRRT